MELILASASQRRQELMRMCGYEFTVMPSEAVEEAAIRDPSELVKRLSLLKAETVMRALPKERRRGAVVLGSDTVVVLDGEIIGKPKSEEEAFAMLRAESGRVNTVYTGVAVVRCADTPSGEELVSTAVSDACDVRFAELEDDEILDYIATGDPMDKAGAYGIQGRFSMFIEGISGSYFTVMGLPIHLVYRELKKLGILPRPHAAETPE